MIQNLYATQHFLSLMLSKTLMKFTALSSFYNDSLDKSSPNFKNFLLKGRGYATFNRNAAFDLIPVSMVQNSNNKVMQ